MPEIYLADRCRINFGFSALDFENSGIAENPENRDGWSAPDDQGSCGEIFLGPSHGFSIRACGLGGLGDCFAFMVLAVIADCQLPQLFGEAG